MQREIQHKFSQLLGFPFRRGYGRIVRMMDDIDKYSGKLTFNISFHDEGWTAQCLQIPTIITGSNNSQPTVKEIDELVKDAIFTAYAIPPHLCDSRFFMNKDEFFEEIKKRQSSMATLEFNKQFAYGL